MKLGGFGGPLEDTCVPHLDRRPAHLSTCNASLPIQPPGSQPSAGSQLPTGGQLPAPSSLALAACAHPDCAHHKFDHVLDG